jgi:folylpolyglutamate synthase
MIVDRSYQRALDILSSLIQFKSRSDALNWRDAFGNMDIYLQRIGLQHESLRRLQLVHVAGTKGKGSTCAMIESILRNCGYRTGLFTSPHLMDVRERIRVNGGLVDKDVFLEHFWHCHDELQAKATADIGVPGYFRFMTLLALRIFEASGLDVVILELESVEG